MNLATMRTKFKDQLAGLATAVSDGEIDVLLNGAYQYTIPDALPGFITEGEWELTTVAGTGSYAFPDTVYSVHMRQPELDDRKYLGYYSRPSIFFNRYDRVSPQNARPLGALFYGETVELRPIPDAVYTIHIYARLYPDALTSDGLVSRTHALATIYSAAQEWAEERDQELLMAKLQQRYATQLKLLRTRSNNRPRERYHLRSF